jgi:outer membrane protein assembly factor BamB
MVYMVIKNTLIRRIKKMREISTITVLLVLLSGYSIAQESLADYEKYWPQWRGPSASGVALTGDPPTEWNENLNIKWKAEVPGIGHATPIIWEDQIILLSAVKTDQEVKPEEPDEDQQQNDWMAPVITNFIHEFVVFSIDRKDGTIRWQTIVREELPHSHTHQFGSWASNSPVTDGERIFAYFGSHGLYCLNMEGEILWERDFGQMQKVRSFGEGCSPVLYENKLIVLRDHEGQSFLYVLDKRTGKDIMEIKRNEVSSWSTPHIIEFEGKTQIITSATNKIRSYDPGTGEVIWECSGMTRNVIPSPVMGNGIVYLMSGFRGSALIAVDLAKAKGDISDSDAIIWKYALNTPYTPSPVLMDGKLYFLKVNNGYLSCLDAKDGKEYYSAQKLEGIQNIFTSPVGVKDRIYIAGTNGSFCVVKHGTDFEVLAINTLDDSFYASPVIIGDNLYLRGNKYLYCISEEE